MLPFGQNETIVNAREGRRRGRRRRRRKKEERVTLGENKDKLLLGYIELQHNSSTPIFPIFSRGMDYIGSFQGKSSRAPSLLIIQSCDYAIYHSFVPTMDCFR